MLALLRGHRVAKPLSRSISTIKTPLNTARQRNAPVDIHPEVEDALNSGKPVVAMETALVTDGMPYPTNLDISLELSNIVRSYGAIPAIIGLIGGRVKIGLEKKELERLAERTGNPTKISRRDIAPAIATKADGGTTICATMIFAALAGIKVFATGGLGGVHRGGENSLDISADLQELARCPVGVVSSGSKSILDIGRTLEYLETLGVPVISYGESREFPAFFTRRSGFQVPWNVTDPETAAKILHSQWQLGLTNGALIAAPIPEEFEADGKIIQECIDQAIAESEANGISKSGKEVTPWLLQRVTELSKGVSLDANLGLIRNTTHIGTQIAVQYQKLVNESSPTYIQTRTSSPTALSHEPVTTTSQPSTPANLLVIGSAAVDITAQHQKDTVTAHATHSTAPGTVSISLGGVARNIAEASHRTLSAYGSTASSLLVAPVGKDIFGRLLVQETMKLGMRTDGLVDSNKRTAVCNMVLDCDGGLVGGVADMNITESFSSNAIINQIEKHKPTIVAMDGNLFPQTISDITSCCISHGIQVFFEPTSVTKSTSILPAVSTCLNSSDGAAIDFFSPNIIEISHLYERAQSEDYNLMAHPTWWSVIDRLSLGSTFRLELEHIAKRNVSDLEPSKGTLAFLIDRGIVQMAVNLLPFFKHQFIKCGDKGVLVVMRLPRTGSSWTKQNSDPLKRLIVAQSKSDDIVVVQHFAPIPLKTIVNVTGAGDSFVGALLASLIQTPTTLQSPSLLQNVIFTAQNAAVLTLQSHSAVSSSLSVKENMTPTP